MSDAKIQILGLRPWFNPKKQAWQKIETFFEKKWRAESVGDILKDPQSFLNQIVIDERYNLYFTVAHCHEMKGRVLSEQWVIPFDIDDVPEDKAKEVLYRALQAIGLIPEEVGSLYSGHGIQFFVQLKRPITGIEYFDQVRNHYKAILEKIKVALTAYGLPGKMDPSVWSPARLMRFPMTINRKDGLPDARAYVFNANMVPLDFKLEEKSGLPNVATNEQISPSFLAKYPEIDVKAVEEGCEFLKWGRMNPSEVREFQWYAELSIVGRFPNGKDYAHAYSTGHPGYNPHETDAKLDQALQASGPRTCKNIEGMWDGCKKCPHYGKVTSPILIKGPDFVKTASTGFHDVVMDKEGNPKTGKPNVHDLWRHFNKEVNYLSMRKSERIYTHDSIKWNEFGEQDLEQYADEKFMPKVGSAIRREFVSKVKIHNLKDHLWLGDSTFQKINFQNGVLDLGTMSLAPHSADYGFRYVLDYDYDLNAECPRFDRFMDEVTGNVEDYKQVLLEFMGYCFSNDNCWAQKALFMLGSGQNGKSTLCDLMRAMAAPGSYSSILSHNMDDTTHMLQLDGSLFNISEETGSYSMRDVETFKNITNGGEIFVKRMYEQPYAIRNRAKLIFSCNDMPEVRDYSHAMFRRMIIIPFNQRFEVGGEPDLDARLKSERSGIFNKIMQAYGKARAQGRFSLTEQVTSLVEGHREDIDLVRTWFNDNYEVLPKDLWNEERSASKKEIFTQFVEYCKFDAFDKPPNSTHFWRRVKHFIRDLSEREFRPRAQNRDRILLGVVKRTDREEF